MGGRLPDVRRHVAGRLFDGQHHDGDDDGHPDTGQHAQRTGSDQLVGVLAESRGSGERYEASIHLQMEVRGSGERYEASWHVGSALAYLLFSSSCIVIGKHRIMSIYTFNHCKLTIARP